MKLLAILNHLENLCRKWNEATPTERCKIINRIKGAAAMADTCGYTVEIWTESNHSKSLCYIRIGDKSTGEMLGRSPNHTQWYNCYKFWKVIDYGTEHMKY